MSVCFPPWRRLPRCYGSTTVTVLLGEGMAPLSQSSDHVDVSSAKNTMKMMLICMRRSTPLERPTPTVASATRRFISTTVTVLLVDGIARPSRTSEHIL